MLLGVEGLLVACGETARSALLIPRWRVALLDRDLWLWHFRESDCMRISKCDAVALCGLKSVWMWLISQDPV